MKVLKAYGAAAAPAIQDLRDLAANPTEKDYNRRDVAVALGALFQRQVANRCAFAENLTIDLHQYACCPVRILTVIGKVIACFLTGSSVFGSSRFVVMRSDIPMWMP